MLERRKPPNEVTPAYEDGGIYKNGLVQLNVEFVPLSSHSSRHDLVIKAFVDGDSPIEVVFAGRRKIQAKPLMALLQAKLAHARKAAAKKGAAVEIDQVRYPARIEGSWRPRFRRDDQGWETRHHQLFPARWILKDQNGNPISFGETTVK